jgi:hypothetical protein
MTIDLAARQVTTTSGGPLRGSFRIIEATETLIRFADMGKPDDVTGSIDRFTGTLFAWIILGECHFILNLTCQPARPLF